MQLEREALPRTGGESEDRPEAQRVRMHEPLCCERVEVEMGEYLEGGLPRPLHLRIDSHVTVCVECWVEVQKFRYTIASTADLPRLTMPPELKERIIHARRTIEESPGATCRSGGSFEHRRRPPSAH